ncbi:methionine--tRNA ligase [Mesomycoplasma hyorhinis]|uniref:methionine--tRNA ligase n=1 Tax=Mesomycoplasma hyorhinis TaxID=2100 RepID=UPI001C04993A|nr:methionine--tRNA ligase [Mesomycoplasma hyorhinis]
MKKTFYVTTPIYYASGDLHIGHLYTTTLAWVIKRYKQLVGFDTKMLTGSDEHGLKIQQKAEQNKLDIQIFVDQVVKKFENLWQKLDIDYDFFSRTTSDKHKKIVAQIFEKMLEKGLIYKGKYSGWYSISDEEFLTPTQAVLKNGKYYHPVSDNLLEYFEQETYFFNMKKFAPWLLSYWKENPNFVINKKIQNELEKNFLEKGLEDLSVTRTDLEWGIKVISDQKHTIYVWLDALFNYLTALNFDLENDQDYQKYWKNGDQILHIVGKEITRFHCIYWPIFLKSLDIKLPTSILSHGWIITNEGKMSKSKGNVVDPIKLLEQYDKEVIKLFFASQIPVGSDGIFDQENLTLFYNSTLANNFGNLITRTITMIFKNFDRPVRYKKEELLEEDKQIFEAIIETKNNYIKHFDNYELDKAFKEVFSLSKKLNGYIDITKPWSETNKDRLEVILNTLINGIYAVNTLLSVCLKNTSQKVLKLLKLEKNDINQVENFSKFDNLFLDKAEVIFERMK